MDKQLLDPKRITVRKMRSEDIPLVTSYWCGQEPQFWISRGVDPLKMRSKPDFVAFYNAQFEQKGKVDGLFIIELDGVAIGLHSMTDLVPGESGVFHAHIWKPEHRKIGVAPVSYIKAMKAFVDEYKLQKVIFKTPLLNKGALRVKEKIGLKAVGPTTFQSPILIGPLEAMLYEVSREEVSTLFEKL